MQANIVSDNMDLNENSPSGLKGKAQQGIRTELSGITLSKAKSRMVKIDGGLPLNGCSQAVEIDRRGYIPASPVHVEECSGCGVWADGGGDTQLLPTLKEEEEDDEVYSSDNSDSWSVVSSSYDSLNFSTEYLLLNVEHPGIINELTEIHPGAADLLSSMMEEKTCRLGKMSMRCGNCLEKFLWEVEELEACLFKHIAKCWQRNKEVSDLSLISENGVENELESFEKEVLRSEFSEIKSLVSAMLASEWDFKPIRCAPECNRDHCREARNDDTIDSEDLNDSDNWDDGISSKEALIDSATEDEAVERNTGTEDATELDDSVVAEQRMLVFLISASGSIWQDKMAVVLGLSNHATLDDLDSVLRRLWVDCCGHASSLTLGQGKETFSFPDLEGGMDKLSIIEKCKHVDEKNRTNLESSFGKIGSTAVYTYDPNRPTTLNISSMGAMDLAFTEEAEFPSHTDFYLRGHDMLRPSNRSPMPATVLLRNTRPEVVCAECHESYVLLLDSSKADLQPKISSSPHGVLFQPTGFCSMDCVMAFNEEMSLVPDHNDSICVDRSQLVYMSNSPRAGMCRYASLELDSSVNTRSTEATTYSAFTMDTSCSCPNCLSDCSQNCSMTDYTDTDHSYSKSEGSPRVVTSLIRNGATSGTPVLTGYNMRSTSVDTPPTRLLTSMDSLANRE